MKIAYGRHYFCFSFYKTRYPKNILYYSNMYYHAVFQHPNCRSASMFVLLMLEKPYVRRSLIALFIKIRRLV
jgi:hypothetical protein